MSIDNHRIKKLIIEVLAELVGLERFPEIYRAESMLRGLLAELNGSTARAVDPRETAE